MRDPFLTPEQIAALSQGGQITPDQGGRMRANLDALDARAGVLGQGFSQMLVPPPGQASQQPALPPPQVPAPAPARPAPQRHQQRRPDKDEMFILGAFAKVLTARDSDGINFQGKEGQDFIPFFKVPKQVQGWMEQRLGRGAIHGWIKEDMEPREWVLMQKLYHQGVTEQARGREVGGVRQ